MKIVKKLFFAIMVISSICLFSCEGGSDGDDGYDPEPFVKLTISNAEYVWKKGFTDYASGVPAGCQADRNWTTYRWIACGVTLVTDSFNKDINDHILITTSDDTVKEYGPSTCNIYMRVSGLESGSQFQLTITKMKITTSTSSYIDGSFEGKTPMGYFSVEGSFVFKKTANETWPINLLPHPPY